MNEHKPEDRSSANERRDGVWCVYYVPDDLVPEIRAVFKTAEQAWSNRIDVERIGFLPFSASAFDELP